MIRVSRSGQIFGPYSVEMARAYIHTGHIQKDDLVWSEDQSSWVATHEHPLLKDSQPAPPPLVLPPFTPTRKRTSVGGWLLILCILLTIVNPLSTVGYLAYIWSFDSPLQPAPDKAPYTFKEISDKFTELQATHPDLVQGMTLGDYSQRLNQQSNSHEFDEGLNPNLGKYAGAEVDGALYAVGLGAFTSRVYYTEPVLLTVFLLGSAIWFFVTGYNLWKIKPAAVMRAKYFLIFMASFPLLSVLIIRIDGIPCQLRDYLTTGMVYQIIPQIFWATVWYLYLTHSKRVCETFLKSGKS